MTKISDNTILN